MFLYDTPIENVLPLCYAGQNCQIRLQNLLCSVVQYVTDEMTTVKQKVLTEKKKNEMRN